MSGPKRLLLVALAVVVAGVAFALLRPSDEAEDRSSAAPRTPGAETSGRAETAPAPPPPRVERVRIQAGRPVGGARRVEVSRGESVRIVITADAPDELHLHGYDITRSAAPGRPARFLVRARAEGQFELESHTAEDAGLDARVLTLVVRPS